MEFMAQSAAGASKELVLLSVVTQLATQVTQLTHLLQECLAKSSQATLAAPGEPGTATMWWPCGETNIQQLGASGKMENYSQSQ